ncbi:MAG: M30 family zinc metallopeptidase [Candidatus Saccharimonadaceae bacterium]
MKSFVLRILSLCLLVLSCQKEEDPSITIKETSIVISYAGGSQTIAVESNVSWTTKSSENWCTISPSSGDASVKSIKVTLAANDAFEDRVCTVTISGGGLIRTLSVNQNSNLGIIVTQGKYELSNDAATIEVEVKANVEFDVSISDEWIKRNTTRGLSSNKLYFDVAKNDSYSNREGSVTIKQKDGTLSKTVSIYQSQKNAIILSNNTQSLSDESQTLEIELKTNVDFEVIIPVTAKNWVSYAGTRALRTETLILIIAANVADKTRTTEVYVKNKTTTLQDTLTITQSKATALPTLTTLDTYDILITAAKSGGEITSDGGAPIIAKGVCWNTSGNPTVQDSKTNNGGGVEKFIAQITPLIAATTYYAKAYATNRVGTSYGKQIIFTTTSKVATPIISLKSGIYTSAQLVTITCATEGAEIRYTLNGNEPVTTSTLYTDGITVNERLTIKAKAFKTNWIESAVATQTYIINLGVQLIEGSLNSIQHIDASKDFVFRLNNLSNKDVYFVFTNKNTVNSTTLPKLYTQVETMKPAKQFATFSESTFLVSGKPSITDFNNNPLKQPMKGMSQSEYQRYSTLVPEKYIVGNSMLFNDDAGNSQLSTVRKIISAHGKNLYVWVADDCWGPTSSKRYNVTQQMVDAFAPKFLNPGNDNDIYEWVSNIGGAPWGNSRYNNVIPDTDDIHIWLTDIDNDNKTSGQVTLGYFFARDNYLKTSFASSNEKLMFTIDAVIFATTTNGTWELSHNLPKQMVSALAHEFTHMIYFYQNNVLNGFSGNTAINEMCTQSVEDLVANKIMADGPRGVSYSTPTAGYSGNMNGRLPLYNSYNDYSLVEWSSNQSETLLNYSKTYALGAYLMRNYGGANFIRELIQNSSTGINSIVDAVNSNGGGGLSYEDILQRFGAANLLSDNTSMDVRYRFNTGGAWSTSTINGINYQLGSVNLYNYAPTPSIYSELPTNQKPGSNIYYKAGSNLNGTIEWSFEGMSTDTKLTVVIK